MNNSELSRRLQLALSYREKAQQTLGDQVPRGEDHVQAAEDHVARVKAAIRRTSEKLAAQLRVTLDERERIRASVLAGRRSREEARALWQRLVPRIKRLRGALGELNALHAAESAQAAGGFLDLPLDRYGPAIRRRSFALRRPGTGRGWSRSAQAALALVVLGVAASAVLMLRVSPLSGKVRFEAQLDADNPRVVELRCQNATRSPIAFHADWARQGGGGAAGHYGVSVYVREQGGSAWRRLPTAGTGWRHNGLPVTGEGTFTVDPGFSMVLGLDTAHLAGLGAPPDAIRLEFLRGSGRVIATFEADLEE